jgi:hypothetical protein
MSVSVAPALKKLFVLVSLIVSLFPTVSAVSMFFLSPLGAALTLSFKETVHS